MIAMSKSTEEKLLMVAFILGLLFITIVIFLLIYYINILKKGKYTIGKIYKPARLRKKHIGN